MSIPEILTVHWSSTSKFLVAMSLKNINMYPNNQILDILPVNNILAMQMQNLMDFG